MSLVIFSVRPCYSRASDPSRRPLEEIRAQPRQVPSAMGHNGPSHTFPRLFRRGIRDHRHGSGVDRLINEPVAVATFSVHGHEHASWLHPARVVFDSTHPGISALREDLGTIQ